MPLPVGRKGRPAHHEGKLGSRTGFVAEVLQGRIYSMHPRAALAFPAYKPLCFPSPLSSVSSFYSLSKQSSNLIPHIWSHCRPHPVWSLHATWLLSWLSPLLPLPTHTLSLSHNGRCSARIPAYHPCSASLNYFSEPEIQWHGSHTVSSFVPERHAYKPCTN